MTLAHHKTQSCNCSLANISEKLGYVWQIIVDWDTRWFLIIIFLLEMLWKQRKLSCASLSPSRYVMLLSNKTRFVPRPRSLQLELWDWCGHVASFPLSPFLPVFPRNATVPGNEAATVNLQKPCQECTLSRTPNLSGRTQWSTCNEAIMWASKAQWFIKVIYVWRPETILYGFVVTAGHSPASITVFLVKLRGHKGNGVSWRKKKITVRIFNTFKYI